MRLPDSFTSKKKDSDEKLADFLSRTEKDLPGGLDSEGLTDKVCRYLDVSSYGFFYQRERKQIIEQVEKLNNTKHKTLQTIEERVDGFEKTLKEKNIEWRLLSDEYTKENFERNKKELKKYIKRMPVMGYSRVVNYLPAKAAGYFFDKSEGSWDFPTWWDVLGVLSYVAVLAGETAAVSAVAGLGTLFCISALTTGFLNAVWNFDYNWDSMQYHWGLLKDYKKIKENKKLIESLKQEKAEITNFIKDHIEFEKTRLY